MYRKQVRRRRAVLALLVISAFTLLTVTYGEESGSFQRTVSSIFSPLQEGADRALKPGRDLVNWFDETFDARGENERLTEELGEAQQAAVAGEVAVAERDELAKILKLRRELPSGYEPVIGRVIAKSPSVWYSTVTIDKGTSAGVAVEDPVVSQGYLIGRISSASGGSSQVQLITDPDSFVTAKILDNGAQGIVNPEVGDPDDLILDFISAGEPVDRGATVVTAGWRSTDGLASKFPPNIPLGEVTEAPIAEQAASAQVHLRPFADLSELDFVDVLTGGSR